MLSSESPLVGSGDGGDRASLASVARRAGVSIGTVSNYFNRPSIVTGRTSERISAAIEELGYVRGDRGARPGSAGPSEVGISEVAAAAGVSVGTVSNYVNRPEMLSPDTSRRVQAAIDKLGYVRNISARNLRLGTSRTLGLLVLDIGNPFFTDLVKGVEEVAAPEGYAVILGNTEGEVARQEAYLGLFEEQRVGGVIVSPTGDVDSRIRDLQRRGTKAVLIAEEPENPEYSSISVDDRFGGRLAIEHLLDTGRRKIAFISGPSNILQVQSRRAGVEDAIVDAAADAEFRIIEADAFTVAAGRDAAESLFTRSDLPDAIFAANDLLALGVLQAAFASGISIPSQIALMGYDDISFAGGAAVPLTSIRQPSRSMGAMAARMLLDEFAPATRDQHRHVTFMPELIVRRSTQPSV